MVILDDEEELVLEEDLVLGGDITKEDKKEWVIAPAPAPAPVPALAPAPTPAPALAPALEPLLEEAAHVPPPVAPEVEDEMGWTHKYYFKQALDMAYYHSLLTNMLDDYYLDLHASIKYYCAEYMHPLEDTYWKTKVSITAWNDIKNGPEV